MATSIQQLKASTLAQAEANVIPPKTWPEVLKHYAVDEVVAVSAWDQSAIWNELAEACADRGVIFRQLVVMPKPKVGRYHIEDAGNNSYFVSLETVPQEHLTLAIKRGLDLVGALFGVMLCALVYPFYALWLRIISPGPTLFRQERLGRNGRHFTLYKFRTMRPNAEAELHELMALNEMRGALFKIKDDPRVVAGGTFMRRTHLDELPQFWNVLIGDMSLVGTRPPTRLEVESYEDRHYRRLSMRPGITGMWQVTGNGAVHDFEEVVKLDCQYIDNWSLGLDLKLIGRTLIKSARFGGW
jgi:lipopolysaccharide/colanic/teichoic acid biosynthesis glycosyltransferase